MMPKKVLQDINTRNTNIKKENFRRKWDYSRGGAGIVEREPSDSKGSVSGSSVPDMSGASKNSIPDTVHNNGGGNRRKGFSGLSRSIWISAIVLVAVVLFLMFWSMFSTATVQIILSQQTTTINDTFSATHGDNSEGVLSYEVIKLQEKATKDVQPTKEENVERKASGKIVVYNRYGNEPQKLIVNTRFEAPDGRIYRIDKPIVVPGAKGSGDDMIPGNIEVTVYADKPGKEYNIGLVDFTIPGLEDTPLRDGFFAKSKTEILGGHSGVLKTASQEDIDKTSQSLREEIRASLLSEIRSAVGDDNILYDDAVFVDFTTHVPTEVSENGMLTIEETGLLQAIVFNRKELSSKIAEKSLSSYDGSIVLVRNLDETHFAFEKKEEFNPAINDSFNFILSGTPHIVWEIDKEAFKNDLAGLSKDSKATITQNYSSIRKIEATIKPFWKGSFPDNPDSITVEEVLE